MSVQGYYHGERRDVRAQVSGSLSRRFSFSTNWPSTSEETDGHLLGFCRGSSATGCGTAASSHCAIRDSGQGRSCPAKGQWGRHKWDDTQAACCQLQNVGSNNCRIGQACSHILLEKRADDAAGEAEDCKRTWLMSSYVVETNFRKVGTCTFSHGRGK